MNFCGNQFTWEQPAQPLRGCGMSKDSSVEAINSPCSLLSLLPRLQGLHLGRAAESTFDSATAMSEIHGKRLLWQEPRGP